MKIGSICSGMGMCLHGVGNPLWAIEFDKQIAQVYHANHPHSRLFVQPAQSVDPHQLADVDCIVATPSCKNASIAKGKPMEAPSDIEVGRAIASIVAAKSPKFFLLENVWGYRNFEAFKYICNDLSQNGYYFRYYHFNLKDWGIAQSRQRLYLAAVKGGAFWDIQPPCLPEKGWYAAIEDLIPDLPESSLAPWQLKKFPQLTDHSNRTPMLFSNKPANTVRAGHASFRALIKRVGGGRESDRLYYELEASPTIKALGRNCGGHSRVLDAVVSDRVVSITPRACLRFFGDKETADKIWLPPQKGLAQEVVGNGASWQIINMLLQHIKN